MPVPWKRMAGRASARITIAPAVYAAGTPVDGTAISLRASGAAAGGSILFITHAGARVGGVTSTISHQHSADGATGWVDIPGIGDHTDVTGDRIYTRTLRLSQRVLPFVRISVNPIGGTSLAFSACIILNGAYRTAVQS
jgi:hypothetical protein